MKKILVLFPKEWDRLEFERPEYRERYEFVYAGFDLFRFPQNVQRASFDVFRFVNGLLERFRHERLDGVFSNNEYFGALADAVAAAVSGLRLARLRARRPGAAPRAAARSPSRRPRRAPAPPACA